MSGCEKRERERERKKDGETLFLCRHVRMMVGSREGRLMVWQRKPEDGSCSCETHGVIVRQHRRINAYIVCVVMLSSMKSSHLQKFKHNKTFGKRSWSPLVS